jgi:hypothetical protein
MVCRCNTYKFPHRFQSGKCHKCKSCGNYYENPIEEVDYNTSEFWGQMKIVKEINIVTPCCGVVLEC